MSKFYFYPNFDMNVGHDNDSLSKYGIKSEGKDYNSCINYLDLFRDYMGQAYSLLANKISIHRWNKMLLLYIHNNISIENVHVSLEFAKLDTSLIWKKVSKKGRLFPMMLENGKGNTYTRCRIPIPDDAIVTSTHPIIYRLQILLDYRCQESHFFISPENHELNDCLGYFFRKLYFIQRQIRGIIFDVPNIFKKDNVLHQKKRIINSLLVEDVGPSKKHIRIENKKISLNIHTTTSQIIEKDIDLNYQSEEELIIPF